MVNKIVAFMVILLLMWPCQGEAKRGLAPVTIETDDFKVTLKFDYGESKMDVELIYKKGVPERFKRDFEPNAAWGADQATVKFLDKNGVELSRVDFYMNSTCTVEAGKLRCWDTAPITTSDYPRIVNVVVPA